jgi:hypothetical protein
MFNSSPFSFDGYLAIPELEAKINVCFNEMQPYVNGLIDKRIMNLLLGAQLKTDSVGHLRHLLFFLMTLDAERAKDKEIELEANWKPNSYYIELFSTEKLRDYYLARLSNGVVNFLFTTFGFDYRNPETMKQYGIGKTIIGGGDTSLKVLNYEEKVVVF